MMLLSTVLLAGTCVSTKVGWLGDIDDDTYAVFMHAAQRYDVTPHFCETAAACGDLDGLRDCAAVVTPLTGTLLEVAAQSASDLNLTLLTTRSTEEGSYYRLGPQPRHRLQALVDLAAVYDWRAIGAVVDVENMPLATQLDAMLRRAVGTGLQVLATTLNDITPVSLSGAKVAFALTKSKTLAQRVGSVAAWLAIDSTNDDWLVASYDPPWDAGNATLKAVELAGNWSDIFDRDDAYVPRIIIKSNGTRIWDGVTLTPSRFDSIEDGRGCDFSRSGAARYFCETCPAGRFQVKAAQKASCVDCVFPSTNFGGGDVCDACLDGYVNTVDNGTAVCRECPRGFLCHEGSTRRNVTLRRGFWRAAYELEATKCRKRNCEGGIGKGDALCRDGSMGPACDVCIKGRAPSRRGTCRLCDDANAAVLFATLVVVVMALLIIGGRVSKSTLADDARARSRLRLAFKLRAKWRILFVAAQLLALQRIEGVRYPGVYRHVPLDALALDVPTLLAPLACRLSAGVGFYARLRVATLGPPVLVVLYALLKWTTRSASLAPVPAFALLVSFCVFPVVSVTVLQSFGCDVVGSSQYLRADYGVRCGSSQHYWNRAYAIICVFAYPLGVPLFYFYLLRKDRDGLDPIIDGKRARKHDEERLEATQTQRLADANLRSSSMLWGPYEPQHYLWEVWECIRRLLTGGLAPLLFPFRPVLQIALSLTIALASLKLYVTYKPFSVDADDRLAELLCWILVLTQLAVLVHEGTYRRDSEAVGWALMGLLVSALATGAYLIYVDVRREREVLRDLVKHQKRTLGRRLSSLGSRLGLKVAEEDVDVEGPASPLAAGRA